ncbi:MAG: AsmA family protein [Rhodospirillaceae bacterium]|nr:AsmA family protein [Rhodospirillaceae bacterium]
MRRHSQTAKTATIAGAVFLGLAAVGIAFLLLFDFRPMAERRATEALGRPVTIGELKVRIFPLGMRLADLNVADVPAGQEAPPEKPPFMKAGHVEAVVGFWRLFAGDVVFRHLNVEDAVARVERSADGTLSWQAAKPEEAPTEKGKTETQEAIADDEPLLPEIRDLRLHNVTMLYRDPSTKTNLTLGLETRANDDGREPSLIVKGQGAFAGAPTTLSAAGGSILTLRDTDTPYPVDGTLTSGGTTISVKGTVTDPSKITGLNINLTVKGQDAADLYRIAGIALPATPPYTIATHLDRDGARWIFKNIRWAMGKSDIDGNLTWDMTEKVPRLTGKLHAKFVALDDLGGFIGAAPGEARTPTEVRRQAASRERQHRAEMQHPETEVAEELVIPDQTIDLEKLSAMNADVQFEAEKVESNLPLDRIKAHIVLENGLLNLKPLEFGADRGKIVINIAINGREKPIMTKVDATLQGFPLQRIVGKAGGDNTSWGSIGGHLEFRGTGDSMHRILATSDGNIGFAVGGGQLSLFIVELMGLDIAEVLGISLGKDKPTEIRCIAGDFALEQGKMTARTMVADTKDTIFRGSGSIDLGREVMDMRLHAKPKDFSPATLRSKLLLTGTFADPSFGPDMKNIILKGGAAAILGVFLTPVAGLLALIDAGGGKDANCEALFAEAAK